MRFAVQDYNNIFDLNEIMSRIRDDNGCMLWKGSYIQEGKDKIAVFPISYDGQLISCRVLDIISAILFERFVTLKNRKCRCKICINPAHYIYIL